MEQRNSPFDDSPSYSLEGDPSGTSLSRGINDQELAELCYRLAISLESGIDIRKVWASESERAKGRRKRVFQAIAESVAAGDSLARALKPWYGYFPRLFIVMLSVGEATGTMTDVLRRLSKYYEHQKQVSRNFLSQLAWPMLQLSAALVVVGVLILIGGLIEVEKGKPLDILGIGLSGTSGFLIYAAFLASIVLAALLIYRYLSRRPKLRDAWAEWWTDVPVVGPCLEKFALSRIAWALHLTMNTDLDLRRMVPLVFGVSHNRRYAKQIPSISKAVEKGQLLSSAMIVTGAYPSEFTDALVVAEESGTIVESMQRLSKRYEEEAEQAMNALSTFFAGAIWAVVAGFIVVLIFRVFSFYVGAINDAVNMI